MKKKEKVVDFDIHGIVGVRLIHPTESDVEKISYQLGFPRALLKQEADIVIRFSEKLLTPGLKYLGVNSAGFTDEGFYLLTTGYKNTKIRIPFEDIGGHCEILCESGINWMPLLNLIVTITFLKKKYMPFHASAFIYNGVGVIVAGWKTGGKTEALLSFASNGAKYIGDEWVMLSSDGGQMFGIPAPTSIKEWQFEYIPNLLPKIDLDKKILIALVHFLNTVNRKFKGGVLKNFSLMKWIGRGLPVLNKQLKIWVSPRKFFMNLFFDKSVAPEKIFLIMMHDKPGIEIESCDVKEIARRMIHSNTYELMPLLEYYQAFKFAFPHLGNDLLENLEKVQNNLALNSLAKVQSYKVFRPYPTVSFHELFQQMKYYCKKEIETK